MKNLYKYVFRIFKITFLFFIFISGCVTTNEKVTNITPAELIYMAPDGTPAIGLKAEKKSNALKARMLNFSPAKKDSIRELSKFKTFSVMPMLEFLEFFIFTEEGRVRHESLDDSVEEERMEKILAFSDVEVENKILFELRNFLEEKGYIFVSLNKNPDAVFSISGNLQEYSVYVPPSSYSLPMWVPSETVTEKSSSSGGLDFSVLGDYSTYGWGNWSSTSKRSVRVPGYFKSETYTLPGHTVKGYYPAIGVFGLKSIKKVKTVETLPVFLASAKGVSENPDFSVNAQFVIRSLIEDLQEGLYVHDKNIVKEKIGIKISILTNDGESFFPTIMAIKPGSPAQKGGLKLYDMILAVNNKELSNESYSQVIKYLSLSTDSILDIALWRVDKRIDVRVKPWK